MMYDLPDVSDYSKAIDTCEHKLRAAIALRDAKMEAIEASRHGPVQLSKEDYIQAKIDHGNAEGDAHKFEYYLHSYGRIYMCSEMDRWVREHHEMQITRPSLATVWRHWRNCLAARKAQDELMPEVTTDRWGGDEIAIVTRAMIDAEVAAERATDLYDRLNRAFEGRQPPTWEMMLNGRRVKPPSRPEPTPLSKIQNRRRRKLAKRSAFDNERSPS